MFSTAKRVAANALTYRIAGQALQTWEGGVPGEATPRPRAPRGRSTPDRPVEAPASQANPVTDGSPEELRAVEARVAALEAQAWARDTAAVGEGRQYQGAVEAACQTTTPPDTLQGPLVRNLEASRRGVVGRFEVTHLIVPSALQPAGAPAQTFCGWPFGEGVAALSFDGKLDQGEVCDKCMPTLAARIARRRAATARAVAASLAIAPPPDELDGRP